ncbi:unnamed protein product [Adineta ricciae]|uniref:F-box domain-containing protein n=1 Tax=Adineta ricciae TaxID=249248 RepID=A0A815LET1_ADIRI|nr:unnamed protein product [Adineta ricciae]CAF1639151.1 unnamed protein product [Adineta ricciae]
MSTVSLLDFSVELLFEIFDNLDTQTILKTLRPICTKLYEAAKAYHRYKVILSTSNISYMALVKHVIKPENVTSLSLIDSNRMQSDSSMSFSNLFQVDTFIRLQELRLDWISNELLIEFIHHTVPRLKYLSISFCKESNVTNDVILGYLSLAVTQSNLRNIHFDISKMSNTFVLEKQHLVTTFLRHLTVDTIVFSRYITILSNCTHLQQLTMNNCDVESHNMNMMSTFSISHQQLLFLTINECSLSNMMLHFLLSFTPSLNHLTIISKRQDAIESRLSHHTWEPFIQNRLLNLTKFQFYFSHRVTQKTSYDCTLHGLMQPFETPFWLLEKQWLVTCDYILALSELNIYTKPIAPRNEKLIIRYDTSPSNGTYRLLTKDCSNSTEHTFLEKEFTLDSCTVTNAAAHILEAAFKNNTTLSTVNLGNNKLVHGAMFLLNAIFNIKNLHTLRIRCDQLSAQHFAHLGSLLSRNTSLIHLSFHKNQISFEGLRSLIVGLGFNETLETLIFEDIGIDGSPSNQSQPNGAIEDELAQYVAKILNVNKAMKTLVLPCVRHSAAGIQNLMDALKINTTLKCISLDAHGIDSRGAKFVADALENNTTLSTMSLALNSIGFEGAKYIANALEKNSVLNTLNLRANDIKSDGAMYLSHALRKNSTLTTINLRATQIGPLGSKYIGEMLQENKGLVEINLENNGIEDEGIEHIANALYHNEMLRMLNLSHNNIGAVGARLLANAIKSNTTLTSIVLTNNPIGKEGKQDLMSAMEDRITVITIDIDPKYH